MTFPRERVATIETPYQREQFTALVDALARAVTTRLEQYAMFALICAFWGLLLFAAMQSGLPR